MNGRIYDPGIGRFLTADSFIQFSGNSQSYNRYSYVMNNPMRFSDPSGHFVVTLTVGTMWAVAGKATIGEMFFTFIFTMFAAGTADALIAGADLDQALKAGAFTALSSAVAYGVGTQFGDNAFANGNWSSEAFKHELARAMSHGITQGAIAEAQGSDWESTFAGTFFGSFAGHALDGVGIESAPTQFVFASAVGGTSSVIGGGKFRNGAMGTAFASLFNAFLGDETREILVAEETVNYYYDPLSVADFANALATIGLTSPGPSSVSSYLISTLSNQIAVDLFFSDGIIPFTPEISLGSRDLTLWEKVKYAFGNRTDTEKVGPKSRAQKMNMVGGSWYNDWKDYGNRLPVFIQGLYRVKTTYYSKISVETEEFKAYKKRYW